MLRHYRLLQSVRLPREDGVLWYRCELPIQNPAQRAPLVRLSHVVNDARWLELGERRSGDYPGCLLAVVGAGLAEDPGDPEEGEVLAMLADV